MRAWLPTSHVHWSWENVNSKFLSILPLFSKWRCGLFSLCLGGEKWTWFFFSFAKQNGDVVSKYYLMKRISPWRQRRYLHDTYMYPLSCMLVYGAMCVIHLFWDMLIVTFVVSLYVLIKCFKKRDISTLNSGSLKLEEKLTYLGSSISSAENDIN